jgi:hypothetical protein
MRGEVARAAGKSPNVLLLSLASKGKELLSKIDWGTNQSI